jgi:hypothetical protein
LGTASPTRQTRRSISRPSSSHAIARPATRLPTSSSSERPASQGRRGTNPPSSSLASPTAASACAESTFRRRFPATRGRSSPGKRCGSLSRRGDCRSTVHGKRARRQRDGCHGGPHGRDIVAPPGNPAANREHQLLPKRRQGHGLLSDHGTAETPKQPSLCLRLCAAFLPESVSVSPLDKP